MTDTIFALSSGAPPAALGIIRISGPSARDALAALAGEVPEPRRASLRVLKDGKGEALDQALVLWFPGPDTATGEDLVELHCHGGRAVIAGVERALGALHGFRRAEPGEFTRRAFANGRLDLAEAEALADLLSAETELQRRAAQSAFGGAISEQVEAWREEILRLGAQLEAALDFSDEDDVSELPEAFFNQVSTLSEAMRHWLARPAAERLRDGVRVVLAGPPNSGKSSLFNALLDDAAAIISPQAGTTRDVIERPVALGGIPLVLVDTAGLRLAQDDAIEAMGIERAQAEIAQADLVLWLGPEGEGPHSALEIQTKADLADALPKLAPDFVVSAQSRVGMEVLEAGIMERASALLPKPGQAALNARQRAMTRDAYDALVAIAPGTDLLIIGEHLRSARRAFDALLGRDSTEEMLDALFGRFCIGK
ncbi:tRNA uridine-5-carboxymethylaminomethyl(34) synthesis GTPase MnmE [Erythrobacter sp. W53]|uniref:tRNA uridine-5-carboxymethylaminomethyl(34) synthesis GTPase MnmE n=1 Tax=Erythrobacter sp. W53 TaxID=3425947 RepID=UPI003D76827D